MKVQKHIVTTEEHDVDITDITLLSIEEYEECKEYIPHVSHWWWLRSPGYLSSTAAYVLSDGGVYDCGLLVYNAESGVRPALRISNLESFNLGDKFSLAELEWTVISKDLALCDSFIGTMPFRSDWQAEDANIYDKSDIKKWLDSWARERGLK